MTRKRFLIVRFDGQTPVWEEYDGTSLRPSGPPGAKSRLHVLALVPDRYFFFYLPEGLGIANERRLKAATLLQMNQLFPMSVEGQERNTLRLGPGGMLGYISHPGLADFLREHKQTLDQAGVVTTSFVLAWNAAQARNLPTWTWRSDSGPAAVFAAGRLAYLRGGGSELDVRLRAMDLEETPPAVTPDVAMAALAEGAMGLQGLRVPLGMLAAEEGNVRPWARAVAATVIAGALFCGGQYVRYSAAAGQQQAYENSLKDLYRKALGQNPGSDPYGQLLYKLSQLKGKRSSGSDALDVLASISRASTGDLRVDNFSLTPESGTIRGRIANYESLERFMKNLKEQGSGGYTLEQAQNADEGVQFSLRITL